MRLTKQMNTDIAERDLTQQKNKMLDDIKKLEKTVTYGIS
jgi:hypothetical protein